MLEYLASDMTEAQILEDFPDLTREDLKACIAFAADREQIAYRASRMKLLFDENLSHKLVRLLADLSLLQFMFAIRPRYFYWRLPYS